jgi:hypothetical protein
MRLAWPPPWHLVGSVLISVIALASVHLSPTSLQGDLSLLALIFVSLISGYLAILSLFPAKSDLSGQRRAFLCLVSSATLAGLFSLILEATPRGLQSASLATILSLLAIFLAAVAYGRWSSLPRKRRFLLLPKKGLGSTRAFPRAALAILLLAACFIAALAFAFGPYHFTYEEPSISLKATSPAEALSNQSSSLENGKKLFESESPNKEERLHVNLSQNNSTQSSIQSQFNATKNNSPAIPEDKSNEVVFSMGGSGYVGGGGGGGGGSSSSSETEEKKSVSHEALQPEKAASPTSAATGKASGKVQNNTTVAGKNVSSLSLNSSKNNRTESGNLTQVENASQKDNLTLNRTRTKEIIPAANPAPLISSIATANETKAVTVETKAFTVETKAATVENISSKSVVSNQPINSNESSLSPESDLSRAIRQAEVEREKSLGQGIANSNMPPVLKALTPDRASPQQQGAAVFWKADAADVEGDKILYRFFLDGREVRKWSKTNSWSWLSQDLPPGDYLITVLAIDGKHATEESFDSIINASFTLSRPNQAPVLQELKPDRISPQSKGSIITWTAIAADPDNDKIYYRFAKNDGYVTDWSTSNSWVWDTSSEKPGDYKISVQAKDGLHASKDSFDSSMESTFALTLPNSIPAVTSLKADQSSPQAVGSIITWTAIAADPDGDEISYKFLVNDKEVGKWSSSNSWVWDTSSATPGEYRIKVLARDGRHSSEKSSDSFKDAVITITMADSNSPPVLKSLAPDIAGPAAQGATVIWKAEALDPEGDKILYKFQLNGRDMGRWSESASWKWSSRDLAPGDYKIRVLARDGKHASEDSFDSSMDAVFSLVSEIDQQIDQLMKKRSSETSQQENISSSDIKVASGNGANFNAVLGKSNGTAGQEKTVTPRKLGG